MTDLITIIVDGEVREVEAGSIDLGPPVETIEPVPMITPRQLRLWLLSRGLLAQVPALIEAMPEPDRSVAQIEWEFATVFEHDHPFMKALGSAVGMTDKDIEAGFREAAKL